MQVVGVSETGPGHQERQMGSSSIPANFSSGGIGQRRVIQMEEKGTENKGIGTDPKVEIVTFKSN